jgi:hypothetical protein
LEDTLSIRDCCEFLVEESCPKVSSRLSACPRANTLDGVERLRRASSAEIHHTAHKSALFCRKRPGRILHRACNTRSATRNANSTSLSSWHPRLRGPSWHQHTECHSPFQPKALRRMVLARSKRDLVAATEMPASSAISFTERSFN